MPAVFAAKNIQKENNVKTILDYTVLALIGLSMFVDQIFVEIALEALALILIIVSLIIGWEDDKDTQTVLKAVLTGVLLMSIVCHLTR